jgi:hypothetical protein
MAAESSTAVAAATGPQVSDELRRVQEGKLSPQEYLEMQVDRAVSHLRDHVSSRRLELIKDVLREQLASSPALIELMKRMGISAPAPSSDGA